MTLPGDPATLPSHEWESLRRLAERMEEALEEDPSCDLGRLLPPPSSPRERLVALHELVKIELEFRWGRKRPVTLEDYLQRFPELGPAASFPVTLIYEEYRARHRYGDRPPLEVYRERFPGQFEGLSRKLRAEPVGTLAKTSDPFTKELSEPRTVDSDAAPTGPPQATPAASPRVPTPSKPPSNPSTGSGTILPIGGGYELLQRIGQGEFGEVLKARAPGGRIVALKRLFRPLDHAASQRELKALDLICQLHHPYLLMTELYWIDEGGRLVIVMELADGSLNDWRKECKAAGKDGIPPGPLLEYFHQAAEALDYLHAQQPPVLHRDIKPANLLRVKGFAKVADFGLAREQAPDLTATLCGTPAYMPPEMWNGKPQASSDQYSLAVTYVEMRLGHRCFTAANQRELAFQHLEGRADLKGLEPAEQAVLRRALAKKPDERFPSCVAFVQALQEALAPPKPVEPAQGWGIKVAIASLAFALTAVLTALYFVVTPVKPPPQGTPPVVDWKPKGWEPLDAEVVEDRSGHRYYRRLVRDVGPQKEKVVVVAVTQNAPDDPQTFYAMENKVWNDLYASFMADPGTKALLKKYSTDRPGCERLVRGDWHKGGYAETFNPDPDNPPFYGVDGPQKGRLPVFRVTVTEAHCFAVWLGGRLPTRRQWLKAAGRGEDGRPGPFDGAAGDKTDLAIGPLKDGPWPVDRGNRDVSIYGCRQMASNGYEWTRDLDDKITEIPLERMNLARQVYVQGQSYLSSKPLTFEAMTELDVRNCTESYFDVTFRVVLEQN